MPYVCRAKGHIVEHPDGPYCTRHGAPLIVDCPVCGTEWTATYDENTAWGERGSDFCASCGVPGPWVGRETLIDWLRDRLNDADLDPAKRSELAGVLDRLATMDPDDAKALPGWQALQRHAPKVWELAKPVLSALIGASLKKYLDFGVR
jgi:hypothetical protein